MNRYEEPKYSNAKVSSAGSTVANNEENSEKYRNNIEIVDNWRAAHAYPLDSIFNIVTESVKEYKEVFVVKRLKRLVSIIEKLRRDNNTNLKTMQDLGGCRVIVPNIEDLDEIIEKIKKDIIAKGHTISKEYDYIKKPREISGYRSYHIVVKYNETNSKYNNMKIEIQIRTKLQNSWATAVETIDTIKNTKLKTGTADTEYRKFFKYASALFSYEENTPIVAGVGKNKEEVLKEISRIDKSESIREKLLGFDNAIKLVGEAI